MADGTHIEWTDATWNPITGCSVTSPGCTNCYAMKLAGTRLAQHPSRAGLTTDTKAGPVWTGEVRFNEQWLDQPLRWRRPRRIFVCAHGDLFHESVPDAWIDRVFAVMALAPQHTFQVLTKRAARMRAYVSQLDDYALAETQEYQAASYRVDCEDDPNGSQAWHEGTARLEEAMHTVSATLGKGLPLPNVWLGVSVEDQARADERIPDLLATPAAVRFISAEPLLGDMDLTPWLAPEISCAGCDDGEGYGNRCASRSIPRNEQCPWQRAVQKVTEHGPFSEDGQPSAITCEVVRLNWVIAGGESGPGARPMHPDWARSLRDQCAAAGTAFMFKQWGEWAPIEQCEPKEGREVADLMPDGMRVIHSNALTTTMIRIGKRAAGRLLDGVEHNGFPEVRHG